MKAEEKKQVISEELARKELTNYLENFIDGDIDIDSNYKKCLNAVMSGRLSFGEDLTPTYKLIIPFMQGTEFEKPEIQFKTRILPNTVASLAKGVDLKNDAIVYGLNATAHIIGVAHRKELDHFGKKDYELIQELSAVFQ